MSTKADPQMTQVLELAENYFITIISILKNLDTTAVITSAETRWLNQ